MILPAQLVRMYSTCDQGMITPFCERTEYLGYSHGLSPAGYDVRIAEDVILNYGEFILASTIERFQMPNNILGIVHDKSTWARRGLAVQNTVIEPSWSGYLTLELTMHYSGHGLDIPKGVGIAQIIFHKLSEPTQQPYTGKYNHQGPGPQEAR
jgi:dCTP deaminase